MGPFEFFCAAFFLFLAIGHNKNMGKEVGRKRKRTSNTAESG